MDAHAASESDRHHSHPVHPTHPVNPDSDKEPTENAAPASTPTNHPNPENPVHPVNPDSDKKQDIPPRPHHEYAREHCAPEEESICRSIIRRAADRPDLDSAKREAQRLVEEFNSYAVNRKPEHRAVIVPDDILARSLSQRMEAPETYIFDPADYYHLDRDDFYYCLCRGCDECDELECFIEDLKEEYEDP